MANITGSERERHGAARSKSASENEPSERAGIARAGTTGSGWLWSASVAVGLLVLVVAVAGVKSWADLRFSQTRADELRQEVLDVDLSVQRLQQRIHLLRSNSELLERVTREELGVLRPDEVMVILP